MSRPVSDVEVNGGPSASVARSSQGSPRLSLIFSSPPTKAPTDRGSPTSFNLSRKPSPRLPLLSSSTRAISLLFVRPPSFQSSFLWTLVDLHLLSSSGMLFLFLALFCRHRSTSTFPSRSLGLLDRRQHRLSSFRVRSNHLRRRSAANHHHPRSFLETFIHSAR